MTNALAPYPEIDTLQRECVELGEKIGAQLHCYGQSHEGRPLHAFKLPAEQGDAPNLLLGANLHGIEVIGAFLAREMLRGMLPPEEPVLRELRARANLWIIPTYNPDGYARTFAQQGCGALHELRSNARGVDLNRNFPRPCDRASRSFGFAGSPKPGSANYRGPHALSEPESAALFAWLRTAKIHCTLNLHSFSGGLIPARVRSAHDFSLYRRLHRAYLAPQARPRFYRLHSRWIDLWTGELEDAQHHILGGWACCVELMTIREMIAQRARGDALFWTFNPRDPERHARRECPRIASAFLESCAFPPPQEGILEHKVWDLKHLRGRRDSSPGAAS